MKSFVKNRRSFIAAATITALAALTIGAVYQRPLSAETRPPAPQATLVPVATIAESNVSLWGTSSPGAWRRSAQYQSTVALVRALGGSWN